MYMIYLLHFIKIEFKFKLRAHSIFLVEEDLPELEMRGSQK